MILPLSVKLSSPQKPNLRRPDWVYKRARSPLLVKPGVGGAMPPTRTIVSPLDALCTRADDAVPGAVLCRYGVPEFYNARKAPWNKK